MAKRASTNRKLSKAVSLLSPSLQRYYRIGRQVLRVKSPVKKGLRSLAAKLNRKRGKKPKLNSDALLKARRFVERLSDTRYLTLLSRKREKQGTPLSWAHVRHLVSVEDDDRRYQLLQDAVEPGWSTVQLIEAIQICEGRTIRGDAGGRPPTKPALMEESLLRLQRLSEKWLALYESVDAKKPKAGSSTATAPTTAKRKLKDKVSKFFRSKKRATRKFENQVAGLVEVLGDQADGLLEVAKLAKVWLNRNRKRARVKRKSPTTRTRRR